MNQVFDLRRFWLLLKLDIADNKKSYLLMSGVIVGLLILLMVPIASSSKRQEFLMTLHAAAFMFVMLGGSLFSSTAFTALSSPGRGIATLMIPASITEKFLATWLVNLFIALLFLGIFIGLHQILIDHVNANLRVGEQTYRVLYKDNLRFYIYIYVLIQAWFFLGSLYFSKIAYIKSAAGLLAIFGSAVVFNQIVGSSFVSDVPGLRHFNTFPFMKWGIATDRFYSIHHPEAIEQLITAFLILFVVSLWMITYVRLKEKEI